MKTEAEGFAALLSQITGAPFTTDKPQENRLRLGAKALWFVWCSDIAYPHETGPLKAAWKDSDGSVWLETSKVADMITLVEREYGEEGVSKMPEVERSVVPTGRIPTEVSIYPKIVELLRAYEEAVVRISKKHGIELKLLYDGGVGVTTVRIGARVRTIGDVEDLRQDITKAADILREAYDSVLKVGTRR